MTEQTSSNISELNRHIINWGRHNNLAIDCPVSGNFNSEIALIGNHVHEGEMLQQIPFVRGYGETLWNALRIEKIIRSETYQTIAIKKLKKAIDPKDDVKASKEEIDHYGALLRWELSQLPNLKYVVILGSFALKCFLDLPDVMKCQGSVYDYELNSKNGPRPVKLIVCIDPDMVLKNTKFRDTLAHNFEKLTRVIKGQFNEPHVYTYYNQPMPFVINYIRQLMRDKLPTALDIEVLNNETACIGLANKVDEALCINFRDEFGNRYTVEEELQIRALLQHWFNRKDEFKPKLVMQNGMFDSYYLGYKDRLRLPPSYFDTMLASHTLASTLPHGLDYLVSRYTDMSYYKDQGKSWRDIKDYPQFWKYNGKDCCGTLAVHYKQIPELEAIQLPEHLDKLYGFKTMLDFFKGHVMRLQPHLIRMTVGGIKADVDKKDQLALDIQADIDKLYLQFYAYVAELTGDAEYKPNPNSSQQLAELFFNKLRLVGRGMATDAVNRTRMINHPKTPEKARQMLLCLNKIKEESKFLSTYVKMKVDEDGRIRCEYKQTGVQSAPGRLSSTSTMWESGANLQNQPERAQELFIIDEGYEASYFDLSQAEARVVGWRFAIKKWIEDFERARLEGGFDAHRSLAADMWHIPYDEVPTEDRDDDGKPTIRYKAKRSRHGFNYTMEGPKLAEIMGISVDEGITLHQIYHRTNPELQIGWQWSYGQIARTNKMFNAYGRQYLNLGRLDPKDLGQIVAFYFQSTIGDKVARCIYLCEDDPEWPKDARMLLNIHDALIAINRVEDGELVRRIMKKHAEETIYIDCIDNKIRELIIPADFKKSVPYKMIKQGDEKIKVPDVHRWSNLEKVKFVS